MGPEIMQTADYHNHFYLSVCQVARENGGKLCLNKAFRNIDDILRKEAGCSSELTFDYTEQTSWLLFLKYLEGLEQDKADEAKMGGQKIQLHPLDKPYRWESWAAPKREGR